MKKFRAVTESGGTYVSDGFAVTIQSGGNSGLWPTVIRPIIIKSAVETPDLLVPWSFDKDDEANPWQDTDVPIIGERFYVSNLDEWRISTTIVSLEVFD